MTPLTPEELLPATAPGVVRVASLTQLVADAAALAKSLSRFPEGEAAQSSLDLVAGQLGFDPRTPAGLKAAGLDGAWPAVVALAAGGPWAVLPVANERRLRDTVARLAKDRLATGAGVPQGEVTVFAGQAGTVALGFRPGCGCRGGEYAVVATGAHAAEVVAQALGARLPGAWGSCRSTGMSLQRLGAGGDLVAWAPAGSPLLPPWHLPGRAFAGEVSFQEGRLQARAVASLAVPEGIALSALSLPAGQELVPDLAPGSAFALRVGGEPSMLYGAWERLPPSARAAAAAAGVDVPAEILQNLEAGVVLGLGVAPRIDPVFSADVRSAAAEPVPLRDPRRLRARARSGEGGRDAREDLRGRAEVRRPGGAATSWKAGRRDVLLRAGGGRLGGPLGADAGGHRGRGRNGGRRWLASPAGRRPTRCPRGSSGPSGHVSSGAGLDTDALRAAVARIPPSAYGGLTGLTVHALVSRFMEPLALVGPIAATLNFDADALTAEAGLTLR